MEKIMMWISDNWLWLGWLLCVILLVLVVREILWMLKGFKVELIDATKEWKKTRGQGSEIRHQIIRSAK